MLAEVPPADGLISKPSATCCLLISVIVHSISCKSVPLAPVWFIIYDGAGYSGELSQTGPPLSMHIPEIPYYERWKVFGGFETNRYSAKNGPTPSYFGFEPEIGKTYDISARIKNSSKNGQKLFFGAAMNYTYGANTAVTTNEYGKDGMEIGNEWTDFNATITIPEGYRTYYDDSGNTEYYNGLYFGMAEGSEYRTAFTIDASRSDSDR